MNVIWLGLFSIMIVRNILYPDLQEILIYSFVMIVYFIVDIIWLFKWPECNSCANDVIFHHFYCIAGLCVMIAVPEARHIGAKIHLTEITTWLSHLRRLLKPKRYLVLNAIFYILLLTVRHVWFPYLAYLLLLRWSEAFYIKFCFIGVLYLNTMYVKWTILLVQALTKKKDDLE